MTNYENMIRDMTPEKLAEIFGGVINPCLMCVYREKKYCELWCLEGIEKWMKQEAVNRNESV